jgi:hypothetical protein
MTANLAVVFFGMNFEIKYYKVINIDYGKE